MKARDPENVLLWYVLCVIGACVAGYYAYCGVAYLLTKGATP